MNSTAAPPPPPPPPSSSPVPKRRGRPRSPVFAYFQRLVDDKGAFVGNQCQFCTFISRDRSENPTYLTRHILRTCIAPQDVKSAMGVRHPSIANASFPPNANSRYNPQKPATVATTNTTNATTQPLPPTTTTTTTTATTTTTPSSAKRPIRKDSKSAITKRSHTQRYQQRRRPTPQAPQEEPKLSQPPPHLLTPQMPSQPALPPSQLPSHPPQPPPPLRRPHNPRKSQKPRPPTVKPQLDLNISQLPVAHSQTQPQPSHILHHPQTAPQPLPPHTLHRPSQQPHTQLHQLPQPPIHPPKHHHPLHKHPSQHPLKQPSPLPQKPLHTSLPPTHHHPPQSHAFQTPPQPSSEIQKPQILPSQQSTVLSVRPPGLTKTRRGRPRSPALVHFRRHVDDKGTFIANQCIHCSFVSRDRSENSTLLLRHLLSQACSTPEDVRVALRGNRYTADGRRATRPGKLISKGIDGSGPRTVTLDRKSNKRALRPIGYVANPDAVATTLVRFLNTYDLDLSVVGSKLFRDMVLALTSTEPPISPSPLDVGSANIQNKLGQSLTETRVGILPTIQQLETFWKNMPSSRLLKLSDLSRNDLPSTSTHLIIHFPQLPPYPDSHSPTTSFSPSNGAISHTSPPTLIASVFHLVGGVHLRYMGSRNCSDNFATNLNDLVVETRATFMSTSGSAHSKFDQIFISRPLANPENVFEIPRNDPDNVWISDVAREIDILCQELLAQVPLLVRCVRRDRMLASFFRERYSERAAVVLFGANIVEKEVFRRYLAHITKSPIAHNCRDVLADAMETFTVLQQVQCSHEDPNRLQETGTFLHTITEENVGSVQVCQEAIRLLLSRPFHNELQAFISIMTPLANLISKYSPERVDQPGNTAVMSQSGRMKLAVFADGRSFQCRSVAHLLQDCVKTLRELYADKFPDYDTDLRILRGHTTCRLLGKGANGHPPIVDDICYVAAFLNPTADLAATNGISLEEAWRRAATFVHTQYGSSTAITVERILEQLRSFHRRSGVFAPSKIFDDVPSDIDPKIWWEKHGRLAPDLSTIAMRILSAPTSAFPIVQFISEMNAKEQDLRSEQRDELKEKKRVIHWNLKLESWREGAERDSNCTDGAGPT